MFSMSVFIRSCFSRKDRDNTLLSSSSLGETSEESSPVSSPASVLIFRSNNNQHKAGRLVGGTAGDGRSATGGTRPGSTLDGASLSLPSLLPLRTKRAKVLKKVLRMATTSLENVLG